MVAGGARQSILHPPRRRRPVILALFAIATVLLASGLPLASAAGSGSDCATWTKAGAFWSYEWCDEAHVLQFRRRGSPGSTVTPLGAHSRTESLGTDNHGRVEEQHFRDGATCTLEEGRTVQRSTVVRVGCCGSVLDANGPHARILKVTEPRTCVYEATACHRRLCNGDPTPSRQHAQGAAAAPAAAPAATGLPVSPGAPGGETFAARRRRLTPPGWFSPLWSPSDGPGWEGESRTAGKGQWAASRAHAREAFHRSLDAYMHNAFPANELRPVACGPRDWDVVPPAMLTLVDALDTLAVMGNATAFARGVALVGAHLTFDLDRNVSLFETTIRLLGGLLSAHALASETSLALAPRYDGILLPLAADLGRRLLPAFRTDTGIPYGTVNLRHGVPAGEVKVASLAGAGTLVLEFGSLSALTGDRAFADAAFRAMHALHARRSPLGLVGKHIHVASGSWTEATSGVGSNSDSFYEYAVKAYALFGDAAMWRMFQELYAPVMRIARRGHWIADVDIRTGAQSRVLFDNLGAFWPGLQIMAGQVAPAVAMLSRLHRAAAPLGMFPEEYNFVKGKPNTGSGGRYLLRPELVESTYLAYEATGDPVWQAASSRLLETVLQRSRAGCGYAVWKEVGVPRPRHDDEMPSYWLAETLKYFYLTFDPANPIARLGWVFNTEGHPLPPARPPTSGGERAPGTAADAIQGKEGKEGKEEDKGKDEEEEEGGVGGQLVPESDHPSRLRRLSAALRSRLLAAPSPLVADQARLRAAAAANRARRRAFLVRQDEARRLASTALAAAWNGAALNAAASWRRWAGAMLPVSEAALHPLLTAPSSAALRRTCAGGDEERWGAGADASGVQLPSPSEVESGAARLTTATQLCAVALRVERAVGGRVRQLPLRMRRQEAVDAATERVLARLRHRPFPDGTRWAAAMARDGRRAVARAWSPGRAEEEEEEEGGSGDARLPPYQGFTRHVHDRLSERTLPSNALPAWCPRLQWWRDLPSHVAAPADGSGERGEGQEGQEHTTRRRMRLLRARRTRAARYARLRWLTDKALVATGVLCDRAATDGVSCTSHDPSDAKQAADCRVENEQLPRSAVAAHRRWWSRASARRQAREAAARASEGGEDEIDEKEDSRSAQSKQVSDGRGGGPSEAQQRGGGGVEAGQAESKGEEDEDEDEEVVDPWLSRPASVVEAVPVFRQLAAAVAQDSGASEDQGVAQILLDALPTLRVPRGTVVALTKPTRVRIPTSDEESEVQMLAPGIGTFNLRQGPDGFSLQRLSLPSEPPFAAAGGGRTDQGKDSKGLLSDGEEEEEEEGEGERVEVGAVSGVVMVATSALGARADRWLLDRRGHGARCEALLEPRWGGEEGGMLRAPPTPAGSSGAAEPPSVAPSAAADALASGLSTLVATVRARAGSPGGKRETVRGSSVAPTAAAAAVAQRAVRDASALVEAVHGDAAALATRGARPLASDDSTAPSPDISVGQASGLRVSADDLMQVAVAAAEAESAAAAAASATEHLVGVMRRACARWGDQACVDSLFPDTVTAPTSAPAPPAEKLALEPGAATAGTRWARRAVVTAAGFGPTALNPVHALSAPLAVAPAGHELACAPPPADAAAAVKGRLLLVDRGQCMFEDKVAHAQAAGAVGVLVCNTHREEATFLMTGHRAALHVGAPARDDAKARVVSEAVHAGLEGVVVTGAGARGDVETQQAAERSLARNVHVGPSGAPSTVEAGSKERTHIPAAMVGGEDCRAFRAAAEQAGPGLRAAAAPGGDQDAWLHATVRCTRASSHAQAAAAQPCGPRGGDSGGHCTPWQRAAAAAEAEAWSSVAPSEEKLSEAGRVLRAGRAAPAAHSGPHHILVTSSSDWAVFVGMLGDQWQLFAVAPGRGGDAAAGAGGQSRVDGLPAVEPPVGDEGEDGVGEEAAGGALGDAPDPGRRHVNGLWGDEEGVGWDGGAEIGL